MPTLLLINGFKFFFYANEHEPKHIHVSKGDEFAKIELLQIHVIKSHMKPKDLKMALKIGNYLARSTTDPLQRERVG